MDPERTLDSRQVVVTLKVAGTRAAIRMRVSVGGPALTPRYFCVIFSVIPRPVCVIPAFLTTCLLLGHRAHIDSEVNTGSGLTLPGRERGIYERRAQERDRTTAVRSPRR